MRTIAACATLLCLLLAACSGDGGSSLKARTENLAAFSVELPDGWSTNIPEGLECTASRCVAGFARAGGSREALTVSVVPNLGKDLAEIAEESTANMAVHGADMRVVSQTPSKVVYEGTIQESPASLVATFDPEAGQVGILLVVDGGEEAGRIVSTLRMKNPVLDFGGGR